MPWRRLIILTEQQPYHSTSASALPWWCGGCMVAGPARTSRSSRRRAGLRRAYHLPRHQPENQRTVVETTAIETFKHTAGTLSLSACDEAASVVTVLRDMVTGEARTWRRKAGAALLRTARESILELRWTVRMEEEED